MPTRTTVPDGAPIWIDLATSDMDVSRAFYGELLGWTSEEPDPEFGGYLNFGVDGQRVAGCMGVMDGQPDAWTVYLATADAEKTCTRAVEAGGTVHAGAMPVRDLGTMAVLADAGGAPVGVWQPGTHRGLLTVDEPGHVGWFELHSRDDAASRDFLTDVFGWHWQTVADSPDFRYHVGSVDGEEVAGLMAAGLTRSEGSTGLAPGTGPRWSVYMHVDDCDVSFARALELGASAVHEPEDSPYGRTAALHDPTGALVKLLSSGAVA